MIVGDEKAGKTNLAYTYITNVFEDVFHRHYKSEPRSRNFKMN